MDNHQNLPIFATNYLNMKKWLLLILSIAVVVCVNPSQATSQKKNTSSSVYTTKAGHKRIYIKQDKKIPGIKALFYVPVGKRDTFHYAIQDNDSIFLWAIIKGKKVRLIRDLK